ncbi:MAG: hypothetical protein UT63_C0063G0007 [Candidatus Gottesmanbacteria bacterium GW2011_GWC2_39_8]|uniref:Glycosyltransferase 2-like domain-containing protein n=1 Tax=Candidatus Gottesmanbacteria bacterium GW2011_GWC2_39_8 TaxID=1618450 RepID=A0A0G0PU56_9BACT|nr:MAG: hypothetical protein UT63_C0063G0007 [Candidatus Gottesmanbacteria bacterium GW2011_GWC2_39_8]
MKNLTNIIIMLYGKTIIKNNLRLLSRDYLIILVENGKERGEKYDGKNFENIKNPENLGFAGGCNVGIEWAIKKGAEYVFLLNQDAWVEDGCIEKLIKRAEAHPEVGILGPVILTGDKLYGAGGEIDKKRFTAGKWISYRVRRC